MIITADTIYDIVRDGVGIVQRGSVLEVMALSGTVKGLISLL